MKKQKFKIWNTETKKMCGVCTLKELLLSETEDAYKDGIFEGSQPPKDRNLKPESEDWNHLVFLQSIGSFDRNKVEIFEEDWVMPLHENKATEKNCGYVEFDPQLAGYLVRYKNGHGWRSFTDMIVIGNRCEHPDWPWLYGGIKIKK